MTETCPKGCVYDPVLDTCVGYNGTSPGVTLFWCVVGIVTFITIEQFIDWIRALRQRRNQRRRAERLAHAEALRQERAEARENGN